MNEAAFFGLGQVITLVGMFVVILYTINGLVNLLSRLPMPRAVRKWRRTE